MTASAQTFRAEYWSVEASKTLVGWDIAKLLYGLRYIDYDERFSYVSQNATQNGSLRSSVDNRMLGVQLGLDLLYPISKHAYTDFRGRLGGFVNFAESDVRFVNNGAVVSLVSNFDDKNNLAGVIDLGGGLRYQLGQMLSVRAGVELWYMTHVASANDQLSYVVSPTTTGRSLRNKSEVLFTGISLGAELRY